MPMTKLIQLRIEHVYLMHAAAAEGKKFMARAAAARRLDRLTLETRVRLMRHSTGAGSHTLTPADAAPSRSTPFKCMQIRFERLSGSSEPTNGMK